MNEKILKQIAIQVIIPANENIANIFKEHYSVEIIGDRVILENKVVKDIEEELEKGIPCFGKIDLSFLDIRKSEDEETSLDEPTFKRKGLRLKVK